MVHKTIDKQRNKVHATIGSFLSPILTPPIVGVVKVGDDGTGGVGGHGVAPLELPGLPSLGTVQYVNSLEVDRDLVSACLWASSETKSRIGLPGGVRP